jgi:hypothetical protein
LLSRGHADDSGDGFQLPPSGSGECLPPHERDGTHRHYGEGAKTSEDGDRGLHRRCRRECDHQAAAAGDAVEDADGERFTACVAVRGTEGQLAEAEVCT